MKKRTALALMLLALLAACTSNNIGINTGPGVGPVPPTLIPGGTPGRILQTLPPNMARPLPVTQTFEGCPAQGDGGDAELNRLKNRIDVGAWQPAAVAAVLALTWPSSIEQQRRSSWSASDQAAIASYEGLPLQLTGYLAGVKQEGPESCNCHSVDYVDFHLWLVDAPNKTRDQSVVVEMTPRVRSTHPGWTIDRLRTLQTNQTRVRISGWLMMDPEHPDQIGKTRGTIWEIHPIIDFEVASGSGWVALDHNSGAALPPAPLPTQADEPPIIIETPEPGTPSTPTPLQGGVAVGSSSVKIISVFAKGTGSNQADEYVAIKNTGSSAVNMGGWTLSDAANHTFHWDHFTILPNQTIRVYTNEVHPDSGGFSYQSSQAIWNNAGDRAYLRDDGDNIVATFSYGNQR